MKKSFIILMAAMVAAGSVSAADNSKNATAQGQAYKHSLGMVAGSGIGVQYKVMFTDHFTLIEEFGYLGSFAAAGNGGSMPTIGAVDNLVLASSRRFLCPLSPKSAYIRPKGLFMPDYAPKIHFPLAYLKKKQ